MTDRSHIANPDIVISDGVMRISRNKIVVKEPHVRQIKNLLVMQRNCVPRRRIGAIGQIPAGQ